MRIYELSIQNCRYGKVIILYYIFYKKYIHAIYYCIICIIEIKKKLFLYVSFYKYYLQFSACPIFFLRYLKKNYNNICNNNKVLY